jgi:hypothetical protein
VRTIRRIHPRAILLGAVTLATVCGLADYALAAPPSSVNAAIKRNVLTVTGTSGGDTIALRLRAGDPSSLEIDVGADGTAEFRFARDRFNTINADGVSGDDRLTIDLSNGGFTDTEATTFDGGDGADTLLGGHGPERLLGGRGDDFIDGQQGADTIDAGDGADLFGWDPGDGSDIVAGGAGSDRVLFNGSSASEAIAFAPTADGHVLLTRTIGTITLDLDDVETTDLHTFAGSDVITVDDLSGTGMTALNTSLGLFGGNPDAVADEVIVNGTSGNDIVTVIDEGPALLTQGLAATVRITNADPSLDRLTVNGLDGEDTITATPAAGALVLLNLQP